MRKSSNLGPSGRPTLDGPTSTNQGEDELDPEVLTWRPRGRLIAEDLGWGPREAIMFGLAARPGEVLPDLDWDQHVTLRERLRQLGREEAFLRALERQLARERERGLGADHVPPPEEPEP